MKNEILFEVNDTKKLKFGTDLHKRNIGYEGDNYNKVDWSVESMLIAIETAQDMGIKIPNKYAEDDPYDRWDCEFCCKINGITYKVHNRHNRKMKIEKI